MSERPNLAVNTDAPVGSASRRPRVASYLDSLGILRSRLRRPF